MKNLQKHKLVKCYPSLLQKKSETCACKHFPLTFVLKYVLRKLKACTEVAPCELRGSGLPDCTVSQLPVKITYIRLNPPSVIMTQNQNESW